MVDKVKENKLSLRISLDRIFIKKTGLLKALFF